MFRTNKKSSSKRSGIQRKKNSPPTQNKPKKQKRKSRRVSSGTTITQIGITECAAKYAVAISDPWSPSAVGACVPTNPARPSQKVTAWRDVIATIGTAGYGCIMLAPTTANNLQAVWHTTSTFSATTPQASIDAAQTGMVSSSITNIPYDHTVQVDTTGYMKPAVMGRVVSAAIWAEYIGTEYDRGGNVICYVDPDHHSVNNISFDNTISRAEASIDAPNSERTPCWIGTNGMDDLELDYPDASYSVTVNPGILSTCYPFSKGVPLAPTGGIDVGRGTPIMIIIFTGKPGNQYRCRVIEHLEFIGATPDAVATPNMTDAKGFELVQAAAALMYKRKSSRPNVPLRKIMKECLVDAWKALTSPAALHAGAALLASL